MLKLTTSKAILLGLSDENLRRLKLGQPIKFNLKEVGLQDMDVVIFNGKDESTMIDMVKDKIGPDTIIK